MKRQPLKKVYPVIIAVFSFLSTINAQSQSIQPHCNCKVTGYGCGTNEACHLTCYNYCRHHHPILRNSNATAGKVSSLNINQNTQNTQAPCIKKQSTLGGSGDEFPGDMISTGGGSFVVCGQTNSHDGNFAVLLSNSFDAYLVKYNNDGHIIWARTYGGTGDDWFQNIIQTNDGGFIAIGSTTSNDGDVSGNHGGDEDVWVVKINSAGNIQWQKCFGGSGDDFGNGIIQNDFGGYAFAAVSNSTDGNVRGNHGNYDVWVVKLNASGNILWQHCYGGSDDDDAVGIIASSYGSLIFSGNTYSGDGDISNYHGLSDLWAAKINVFGTVVWEKTFGGSADDYARVQTITKDGNLVVGGIGNSTDGDANSSNGLANSWLIKLNPNNGTVIWDKHYAEPAERGAFGIVATNDGGIVEVGTSGVGNVAPTFDVLVSKWNASGTELWNATYGGSDEDEANSVFETSNGNVVVFCQSFSSDADVHNAHGGYDEWLIKLGPCGNQKTTGEITEKEITTFSAFPNPTSNSTTISFTLSHSQNASIRIIDINGRLIKTLADNYFEKGSHQVMYDVSNVNAGIYFIKIESAEFNKTEKLIIK